MIIDAREFGRLTSQELVEVMRREPSHAAYRLGSVALDDMLQAQMTPYGVDSVLHWLSEFEQAYAGYCTAEMLGFRE